MLRLSCALLTYIALPSGEGVIKRALSQAVKLLYECHKVRLSKSHPAKIERAETDCTVTKFRGLCDIYSVDPKWVLDLKE